MQDNNTLGRRELFLYFSDNHAFEGYYRTIGEAENTVIEKKTYEGDARCAIQLSKNTKRAITQINKCNEFG